MRGDYAKKKSDMLEKTRLVRNLLHTVNCEYFDVKIFSDSMASVKIKRTKYMRDINDNAVQGRLSKNYLT